QSRSRRSCRCLCRRKRRYRSRSRGRRQCAVRWFGQYDLATANFTSRLGQLKSSSWSGRTYSHLGTMRHDIAPRSSIARGQLMKIAPCLFAVAVLVPASITVSSFAFAQTDTMSTVLQKLTGRIQKLENACGDDIKKFCTGVTPGGGHTVYC